MLRRRLCSWALGGAMLGAMTTSVNALVAPPLNLKGPPKSTVMPSGKSTLAPFAHIRFCKAHPSECRGSGRSERATLTKAKWRELRSVNRAINNAIRPVNDAPGVINDTWSLAPKSGDCEDYAITKRHRLIARGWPPSALALAIAIAPGNGNHAVLVIRTDSGDYVLDNLADEVRPWRALGYKWIKVQSAEHPKRWQKI